MKLNDYRETYYEFSGKLSEIIRNLSFAGIALIWIFKKDATALKVPEEFLLPATFLVLTLALDLLQYIFGSAIWGIFQWYQERNLTDISENPELSSPSYFKLPQFFCFVGKQITLSIAYILLLRYLFKMVFG